MTIAFDNASVTGAGTGDLTVDHTPVADPQGVMVQIAQVGSGVDSVNVVTYGTLPLAEVTGSPFLKTSGEAAGVHIFFAGAAIPTGLQEMKVTRNGAITGKAAVITLTAADDTEVIDTASLNSDALADPTVNLPLAGRTCFVSQVFVSGRQTVGQVDRLDTSWNVRDEADTGSQVAGWYTYDPIASSDVTTGYLSGGTADDVTLLSIALSEIIGGLSIPIAMYHHMKHNLGA